MSPGMHTEDTNRVTDDVREFTCPKCGYQDTEACVDEEYEWGGSIRMKYQHHYLHDYHHQRR